MQIKSGTFGIGAIFAILALILGFLFVVGAGVTVTPITIGVAVILLALAVLL